MIPKPPERGADGGRGEAQRIAGAAHIAMVHHRLEDAQKIEVERSNIHHVNILYNYYQFPI